MRIGVGSAIIVIWLLIGAFAAGQRGYYRDSNESCTELGTTTLTIVAGPLNYMGVNPKAACRAPQPSK
jgi:hypothetical protein